MTLKFPIEARCITPKPVELVRGRGQPLLLVETEPESFRRRRDLYDPLEHRDPKLWEAVWDLAKDPTPEACEGFANEWGFLLGRRVFRTRPSKGRRAADDLYASQEIAGWTDPLAYFALAVEVFREVSTGKWHLVEILGNETWPGGAVYFAHAELGEVKFAVRTNHPTQKSAAAMALLAGLAEEQARVGNLAVELHWDPTQGFAQVAPSPLACAWLQLLDDATALEGGACAICGDWILWDARNRRGKKYCGNRCAVAAHRKRRAR